MNKEAERNKIRFQTFPYPISVLGGRQKVKLGGGLKRTNRGYFFTYHFSDSCLKFAKGNYVI